MELDEVKKYDCIGGACPSVYEVRNSCTAAACPSVHTFGGSYYVVGRSLSEKEIKDMGLSEKVGKGEGVVEVSKSLIEGL